MNAIAIILSTAMQLLQPLLSCRKQVQAFSFSLYVFERWTVGMDEAILRPQGGPETSGWHWTNISRSLALIDHVSRGVISQAQ